MACWGNNLLFLCFHTDTPESFPNVTHEKGLVGRKLTLTCPLNVPNASISWENADGSETEETVSDVWEIDSVDISHAGRYFCLSTNFLLHKARSRFATARAEFVIHVFNSKFLFRFEATNCEKLPFLPQARSLGLKWSNTPFRA